MKTLEQYSRDILDQFALFSSQVDSIIEKMKGENDILKDRWNDQVEGYPSAFVNLLANITIRTAIEWLETNLPKAWMLPALKQSISPPQSDA